MSHSQMQQPISDFLSSLQDKTGSTGNGRLHNQLQHVADTCVQRQWSAWSFKLFHLQDVWHLLLHASGHQNKLCNPGHTHGYVSCVSFTSIKYPQLICSHMLKVVVSCMLRVVTTTEQTPTTRLCSHSLSGNPFPSLVLPPRLLENNQALPKSCSASHSSLASNDLWLASL